MDRFDPLGPEAKIVVEQLRALGAAVPVMAGMAESVSELIDFERACCEGRKTRLAAAREQAEQLAKDPSTGMVGQVILLQLDQLFPHN